MLTGFGHLLQLAALCLPRVLPLKDCWIACNLCLCPTVLLVQVWTSFEALASRAHFAARYGALLREDTRRAQQVPHILYALLQLTRSCTARARVCLSSLLAPNATHQDTLGTHSPTAQATSKKATDPSPPHPAAILRFTTLWDAFTGSTQLEFQERLQIFCDGLGEFLEELLTGLADWLDSTWQLDAGRGDGGRGKGGAHGGEG